MSKESSYKIARDAKLECPHPSNKVLVHSCCAPCSGELFEAFAENNIDQTIFFYNPNIHPRREYHLRKDENKRYADKLGIEFIDADYDVRNWFDRAQGMEDEPERGVRCTMCFDMRFERTALHAFENGFNVITSSLGISRWKNMEQINDCGKRSASHYNGVEYWDYNWRKGGGSSRMYEIAKREEFYAQQYCGCIYSLRDTNKWRQSKGREKIAIGDTWYEEKLESASSSSPSNKKLIQINSN